MHWRTRIAALATASWLVLNVGNAAEPAKQKVEAKPTAAQSTDKAEGKGSKKKGQKCAPVTGSRIRRDTSADCEHSAPGQRIYTPEEIAATGELDVSEALRKVDPRIQ